MTRCQPYFISRRSIFCPAEHRMYCLQDASADVLAQGLLLQVSIEHTSNQAWPEQAA